MFAEVAVPVYVRQTFTYRLPGDMSQRAKSGWRVLVPFGTKYLTAFVVDVRETIEGDVDESDIKEVEELIDESPVITIEMMELPRWISDYYFAPWGECLRAALPAGATSISERVLTLTTAGREALGDLRDGRRRSTKQRALTLIANEDFVTARKLERELSKPQADSLIRQLTREGLVIVEQRIADTRMKPKLKNVVRLTAQGLGEGDWGWGEGDRRLRTDNDEKPRRRKRSTVQHSTPKPKPLNEKQLRVLAVLASSGEPMPFSNLLEAADVSSSVVRTLEKRGIVEVFAREVRRDPLAHIDQPAVQPVTLTTDQQHA